MTAPNYPPGPECWQLRLYLTWGEQEKAQKLLDALNAFNIAFGGKPFVMPEPITGPMEGLVTVDARRVPLADFAGHQLTECVGDPLLKRRVA